jgi:hypothetical protein
MNERIDKLLVKAGAYFGGEGVVYDRFDPVKFAELIAEDCASLVDNQGRFLTFMAMSNKIRDQYGIKK